MGESDQKTQKKPSCFSSYLGPLGDSWDTGSADPIQDLIDTFWTKNPKTILEKYQNDFVKSMIPENRWPEEK